MFLLSRGTQSNLAIPFAKGDLEERVRDQRVTDPFFKGTNAAGDDIRIGASAVIPNLEGSGITQLQKVEVSLVTPSGQSMMMQAQDGNYTKEDDTLVLNGNVTVNSSDGYDIKASQAIVRDRGLNVDIVGPIKGTGPKTTITAGHMAFTRPSKTAPAQIRFTQGVVMVYDPTK